MRLHFQPRFPPLRQQAANLARAAAEATAAAVRGDTMTSTPKEQERRAAICQACPQVAPGPRCRLCGCWLDFKRRLAIWHCPDKPPRW